MVVGEVASRVDLLVIGGGPGGYAAALNASRLGRKVSLVESKFIIKAGPYGNEIVLSIKNLVLMFVSPRNKKIMSEITCSKITYIEYTHKI